jgi:hypothetical protein
VSLNDVFCGISCVHTHTRTHTLTHTHAHAHAHAHTHTHKHTHTHTSSSSSSLPCSAANVLTENQGGAGIIEENDRGGVCNVQKHTHIHIYHHNALLHMHTHTNAHTHTQSHTHTHTHRDVSHLCSGSSALLISSLSLERVAWSTPSPAHTKTHICICECV